ncbi:MAG: MATE family efflux transporter, partial [Oscillospiraceae bacterium]
MSKAKLVRDKEFYKLLFMIAIPIAMQNFISFLIQMLDTIMLGQLGDVAISASSLANQPFFIFTMVTFGIGGGASVLTAQYWGKGEIQPIRTIITIVLRISMLIGVLFAITIIAFPETIMKIYTTDVDVIKNGVDYLRIIGYSYFFYAISNTFYTVMRSVECVKIAVISNIFSLCCNATLNYIFIFGKLGFEAMGVKGAALATLITRILECGIAVIYALAFDKKVKLRIRHFFKFDKLLFSDVLKYSTPVVANEVMWSLG